MVSALAVVALALGIGLTTLMFSIVNGAVLRGLPFEHSERLLHLAPFDTKENDDFSASQWEYSEWRGRQRSFEDLAGFYIGNANVVAPDGTPERYRAAWITPNTFGLLRTRPALGRDFEPSAGRLGAEPVVILSDRVWRDRFASRTDVVGQVIRVNGAAMTVQGVMPPKFAFPVTQDLWVALQLNTAFEARETAPGLEVIGRLRDGVSRDTASAELATIVAQLAPEDPKRRDGGITAEVKTYVEEFIGSETVTLLRVMLAAVMLVLVIACVNVANLVLARAAERTREVAVRSALGAERRQIVAQTLIEVLVLAIVGSGLGLAIADAGTRLFTRAIQDTNPPFWIDVRIDTTVLLFVVGAAALSVVVAGLIPALRATRGDTMPLLNDEGRGSTSVRIGRLSRALVVGEMALSFALLVASVLVIESFVNITHFEPGFATREVFAARVTLPKAEYPDAGAQTRFAATLLDRLRALPGVADAALTTYQPPSGATTAVAIGGRTYPDTRSYPRARTTTISPGYFEVLRLRLLDGRSFHESDVPTAMPVAIVSARFAARHYPEGALGRQVRVAGDEATPWRTIVGIVPDVGEADLSNDVTDAVYFPLTQEPAASVTVMAHAAAGDPLALTGAVRAAVRDLDRNLPIYNVTTLQKALDDDTWAWRVFGGLFTAFGAAGLFLATVGLYGVVAFSVSRRTQEFGVRMAVGADQRAVLALVLVQGARQVAWGVAGGIGLALLLSRAMRVMFFQVSPYDWRVFVAVALLLLLTGFAAALVPARRAARVDPMAALRAQ